MTTFPARGEEDGKTRRTTKVLEARRVFPSFDILRQKYRNTIVDYRNKSSAKRIVAADLKWMAKLYKAPVPLICKHVYTNNALHLISSNQEFLQFTDISKYMPESLSRREENKTPIIFKVCARMRHMIRTLCRIFRIMFGLLHHVEGNAAKSVRSLFWNLAETIYVC